jgi:streptomycin 6-kinase
MRSRRKLHGRIVDVPKAVCQKVMARGPEGQRWLNCLGCLICELEHDWGVTIGPALRGGSESYVAAAKTNSGDDTVVKIEMPPYAPFACEVRTLAAAQGRGYVRLLDHDEGAMLCCRSDSDPHSENPGCPSPPR